MAILGENESFFSKTASDEWLKKDFTKKAIKMSKIQSALLTVSL